VWLLFLAACGCVLLFGAVIFFGEDSETKLGGAAFAIAGAFVALFARVALHVLPGPPRKPRAQPHHVELPEDAEGEFTVQGTGAGRFSKRVWLRVGPEGFDVTIRGRTRHEVWDDVERVKPVRIATSRYSSIATVGYTLRGHRSPLQRLGRWMSGFDRAIPTVEVPPQKLAEVMEQYRQRYSLHA
jgi:hypothetical protein